MNRKDIIELRDAYMMIMRTDGEKGDNKKSGLNTDFTLKLASVIGDILDHELGHGWKKSRLSGPITSTIDDGDDEDDNIFIILICLAIVLLFFGFLYLIMTWGVR